MVIYSTASLDLLPTLQEPFASLAENSPSLTAGGKRGQMGASSPRSSIFQQWLVLIHLTFVKGHSPHKTAFWQPGSGKTFGGNGWELQQPSDF